MIIKNKRLFFVLFLVLCLGGFLLQLQQISQEYFQYKTITRLDVNLGDLQNYVQMYFCPRYIDLVNRTNHQRYNLQAARPLELSSILQEMRSLTIKDILNLTPDAKNIMSTCMVRSADFDTPYFHSNEDCNKIFNITKSVNGERICYSFQLTAKMEYSHSSVSSSLNFLGNVYEIELNEQLSETIVSVFIMRLVNTILAETKHPYHSRLFGDKISNLNTLRQSRISLYPETTRIHRLPPPFDTDCIIGQHSQWCFEECILKNFKKIDRVPWSSFIDEELEMHMLLPADLTNTTITNFVKTAFTRCDKMCRLRTDCESDFTKTRAFEAYDTIHNLTRISAMVPSGGVIDVTSIRQLTLMDYLVQMGSCLGTWFGLSIFSMSSIKLKWSQVFRKEGPRSRRLSLSILQAPKCPCDLCFRRYVLRRLGVKKT